MDDEELNERFNELTREVTSFKRALLVMVVVPALFTFIFFFFVYVQLFNDLPINEMLYYLDGGIGVLNRMDEMNAANRFMWWLNQFPELPYLPEGNPSLSGNVSDFVVINVSDDGS